VSAVEDSAAIIQYVPTTDRHEKCSQQYGVTGGHNKPMISLPIRINGAFYKPWLFSYML